MSLTLIEQVASLRVGSVEFVSPDEIKVALDMEAPEGIAANAGTPRAFPRINGYVLIATEAGFIVGQVEWIAIERSPFPKRKGFQDFGLIDLPFPLRKMRVNPLGMLKGDQSNGFSFSRGIQSFPSVGEPVLIPTDRQLIDIVESGKMRRVKIGTSPLAANASVNVDPDRLFGRHLAVLGNTGSGKSCSVAGLIQWALDAAQKENKNPNARFIILDPNGEYNRVFASEKFKDKTRIFKVGDKLNPLQVPLWFWNTAEWCSFTQASAKAQKPLLQETLRAVRNNIYDYVKNIDLEIRHFLGIILQSARNSRNSGEPFKAFPHPKNFTERIKTWNDSVEFYFEQIKNDSLATLIACLTTACSSHRITVKKDFIDYPSYNKMDVDKIIDTIQNCFCEFGGEENTLLPKSEDAPIPFLGSEFLKLMEAYAVERDSLQYVDTFLSRIHIILSDARMKSIIGDDVTIDLFTWLNRYIGENKAENGWVTVIDLSLVPPEIIHIVTAVIARMTLETLQRYRNIEGKSLPTALIMEEAHTFIKRYKEEEDNQSAASVCCQVFEKIAREGRKYGLGLILSSQRPSELSATVLSQCNTFLLHRISNDRDQEQVGRLVPDNLRGMLRELPVLPSQYAILLGWAAELPILVRMNDLAEHERPRSDDPDFWDVWTGRDVNGKTVSRDIDWKKIVDDWQQSTVISTCMDEDSTPLFFKEEMNAIED